MRSKRQMVETYKVVTVLIVLFGLTSLTSHSDHREARAASRQSAYDPTVQTPALLFDEARTVYLGNLARRDNGVPPLRWNRQLTHAGRWFSWDSVENRPGGYCGHEDTQGNGPWDRAAIWGYLGFAGGENAFCAYVTPPDAINGWMNSPGHRANLLDAAWREIGLGYYRRNSDGRGYIAQVFGGDSVYAPVIIEREALSTTSPAVNLYIYSRVPEAGFAGWGATTQMMVSNDPYFSGAAWEPYGPNKAWTLTGSTGWRKVYVKTRDRFNRTLTVSDSIYLGANVPINELGPAQMSTTQPTVTLYNLNAGSLPQVQMSLGWQADDTYVTFGKLWGNGERVNDASAWGGTAFRLRPGAEESSAWVWDTTFIKNKPMVAYFRLKVNDNTSPAEIGRITINGGGAEYGPLHLKGTDFPASNQYKEFPLDFMFHANPNSDFLTFQFWRSGNVDLYIDVVYIFTAPQPITSPLTWSLPGSNYRGQGIWVRYTNGTQFSGITEAATLPDPSYTISGTAATAGVTLTYVQAGVSKTVASNTSGNYSLSVPRGWTGTVVPSHPCFTFNPASRDYSNVTTNQSSQNYTATFNSASGCANLNILTAGTNRGSFGIPSPGSLRVSFVGVSNGPVKIVSTNNVPFLGAERVIYKAAGGLNTSFSEMMGLPNGQLDTIYWLPWYNNVDLDTQLRFANVSNSTATVRLYIGTQEKTSGCTPSNSPHTLPAGASLRVSCAGVNAGPVKIVSTQNIVAAERVIYKVNGVNASFSEMMALPNKQLSNTYWLPWYNNADLDTQLRFANVSNQQATVRLFIGGQEKTSGCTPSNSPFTMASGASLRVSCAGLNSGPVKIVSTQNIVAAERVIYEANNLPTSFSELMAVPDNPANTTYWLPWYNNVDLDTQLRFANVSDQPATIHLYIGGVEKTSGCTPSNSPYSLAAGASLRVSCTGVNNGPVEIQSTQQLVAAERVIYKVNNIPTSFTEMVGLPESLLNTTYWFPWYNNVDLDTQLRFGVP